MLQLDSKPLPQSVLDVLDNLQTTINAKTSHQDKVAEAQRLWNNKGNTEGKVAFESVKTTLTEMCVGTGICNYCEQSEASDIEHISPKSFFPEFTFSWDNYLLACKLCNSGYKLDQCFVLDTAGNLHKVARGIEPLHREIAFINPRIENPNDFLILNMQTFTFDFMPNLDKRQKHKAIKTRDILGLNERDTLIESRKSTAKSLYGRLQSIVNIQEASTVAEIQNIITPYDGLIDATLPLQTLKEQLKESFKKDIQKTQHPSVWHAIKLVSSKVEPKWNNLFVRLPEALNW